MNENENEFRDFNGIRTHGFCVGADPYIHWPAPNVWVFITHWLEHCSAYAEAMGSNPVELPNFFRVNLQFLNYQIFI